MNSFHRCGGPPPSMREVWGVRRSRPPALPSIGYRGFAVAPMTLRAPARRVVITSGINGRAMRLLLPPSADGPPPSRREVWGLRAFSKPRIQLRVQGRNPARFKGGYGVPRGFKGEKSKSPPNPLGLAERVPRPQAVEGVRRRQKELRKSPSKLHMLHIHHMPDAHQAYDVFSLFSSYCVLFPQTQPSEQHFPRQPFSVK